MNRMNLVIAACFLVECAAAIADEPLTAKGLDGNWSCVSAHNGAERVPEEFAGQLRLTLTADKMTTRRGEQVLFDGTYKIDETNKPAKLDMIGKDGKTLLGLLKADGDSLTICYAIMGKDRPATLDSPPFGVTLVVWKRVEKK